MNRSHYCCFWFTFMLVLSLRPQQARSAEGEDSAQALRVMTYNIRYNNSGDQQNAWPHRKDWLAEIVAREKPDIAGFQEAKIEQFEDLKSRLPNMTGYGVGRDDGKRGGEFVPILFRKDRFEALDQGTFWLSPTPAEPGSKGWDAAITRCVSWLKLKDRSSGQTFFFLNTHFDHKGQKARAESAKLVLEKLRTDFAEWPVVLTGDFNTRSKSEPHATLTGVKAATEDSPKNADAPTSKLERVFRDSYDHSATKPTGPDSTWNGFEKIVPGNRIDFIFATPDIKVQSLAILDDQRDGRFPSDHLPVVAALELPAR